LHQTVYALASGCGVAFDAEALRGAAGVRAAFALRATALRGLDDFCAAALRFLVAFGFFTATAAFGAPPIRNSSILWPALIAAASQRGLRPRPAHVSLGF